MLVESHRHFIPTNRMQQQQRLQVGCSRENAIFFSLSLFSFLFSARANFSERPLAGFTSADGRQLGNELISRSTFFFLFFFHPASRAAAAAFLRISFSKPLFFFSFLNTKLMKICWLFAIHIFALKPFSQII